MIIMFIRFGLGAAAAFPFYIVLRLLYWQRKKVKPEAFREILLFVYVLYISGLIVLVLWPGNRTGQNTSYFLRVVDRLRTGSGINPVPLATIRSYFVGSVDTPFVINIVANVLMFSPTGFFLPLIWPQIQKWQKLFGIGISFSVGIEIAQLFVGRSVDIDDVILNVAGVMLGYSIYALLTRFVPGVKAT